MSKINQILTKWSPGTVASTSYLNKMGLSNDLLHRYVESDWIERMGYGAYKKKFDIIEWQGALYCLQTQKNLSTHPGGKTALELHGLTHYIPFKPKIDLFGASKERLPTWFTKKNWGKTIQYYSFDLFAIDLKKFLFSFDYKSFSILISSPELAAFELLFHVPQKQNFEEAIKIFDNLTTLRSELVQMLLENCNSIKVKRLFLYLAETSDHFWFKDINVKPVNLGKGKRVIEVNGKLDKKYNITVPKNSTYDAEPIF
ncbi:MAG: type IV toxin-antitoxin system AbiEi family antitoxin domain-containing protein [Candidatus Tenebribacter davisii]|jgi:hypothetical protein|nr:type IV toxin-antitoxin system AbiEi family antitoxin domain-containing protein [Candidatus Tenebribacter davisii]